MPHLDRPNLGSGSKSSGSRTSRPVGLSESSGSRRLPRCDVGTVDNSRPSTPEEWVLYAQTKFGTSGRVTDVVQSLADIRPDLLEFLMSVDSDIRSAVRDAVCGRAFPTTRDLWPSSISRSLFQRFLTYINRIPPPLNPIDLIIDEALHRAPSYTSILSSIGQIQATISESAEAKTTTGANRKKRRASNGVRARQKTTTVDPRLFTDVGLQYPTTAQELRDVETHTLHQLQALLEVLLGVFENAQLRDYAQTLVFGKPPRQNSDHLVCSATVDSSTKETANSDTEASPRARPLPVIKYADEDSELGAWLIVLSGRAVSDFRQIRKRDSHVFSMIEKKIAELSQGFFSDSNQKRLAGPDTEVPIYEAKVSRDIRIVYQVDLDTDVDAKVDKQIIRIYGVFTHAQLDRRLWSLISYYHTDRRGKEYRRRCLYRETPRAQGQNVTLPAYFPHQETESTDVSGTALPPATLDGSKFSDTDLLKLHSMVALEKFIPMSKPLIEVILNDPANQVFQVSDKEKEIIHYDSSCFVLGRSGTGKTTTIVFKMLGIEKAFEKANIGTKPRQVFVTRSRVLAQKVREYYQSLISDPSGPSNEVSKLLEDKEDILTDLDDEDASVFGLPPKYSMLEDHHFPLFVNFDQLCSLLEADFGLQLSHIASTKPQPVTEGRRSEREGVYVELGFGRGAGVAEEAVDNACLLTSETTRRSLVAKQVAITFEVFMVAYWPHFNQDHAKGFDPALVYSEFLGVIEGSEGSLESSSGALSREEYMGLSHKKSLLTSQRSRVYDLYEAYRRRKHQLRSYDPAERTHALVTATNKRVPGPKFDCLYIDEAQDNLLIDMKLLRNLSNNPHGIFVAGDTAQTISVGTSFRFEDLKAYMWRLEEKDKAVACGKRKAIHPALFHLSVNYRSHSGIVNCAGSITQLISELFPHSIDALKKETGIADGPKPVFFSGWKRGAAQFGEFFGGDANTQIALGASQAILVRNKAAQDALRAQCGDIGLIFTISESKGLEFDDVLLYNFFEDSAASESTWRVVLHGLDNESIGPIPEFNEIRHGVICAELKNLYVGLTRARNYCWIWDLSENARPMKLFWRRKNLLKECGPNDNMPQLGGGRPSRGASGAELTRGEWILPGSSTKADWEETGRKLFNNRLYPQAMFCFGKANMLLERDISVAYESRRQARLLHASESSNRTARYAAFVKAGDDFVGCAILAKGQQQTSCYLRAAECYLQAEEWTVAAEAYYSANNFEMAAEAFRRAGGLDEAMEVAEAHGSSVEKNVEDGTVELVQSELHACLDWPVQRKTVEWALHGVWKIFPFGTTGDKPQHPAFGPLLEQLSGNQVLSEEESRELGVFQALCANDTNRTIALAELNQAAALDSEHHHSVLALLCFSHSSSQLVPHRKSTIVEFIRKAKLSSSYIGQLLLFSQSLDISSPYTQRLLGFEPMERTELGKGTSPSSTYLIHSTSQMFEEAQKRLRNIAPRPSVLGLFSLAVAGSDTRNYALKVVHDAIRSEIRKMHHASNTSLSLYPCVDFAIFGRCDRSECRRQEVDSRDLPDELRQELFNQRTRALFIQIQMVHGYQVRSYVNKSERRDFRRVWARRLYENLMPHFPPLGSNVCVDPRRIPELIEGVNAVSTWCEDALQELDPKFGLPNQFLSDVLVHLDISFRINRRSHISTLHSKKLVRPREDLMVENLGADPGKHSIVSDFIYFYDRKSQNIIAGAIRAVHHVVFKPLTIEANVLVNILEFIGREIVVQWRLYKKDNGGAFNQLLVPRSWALEVVTRPPLPSQKEIILCDFMNVLYRTLELLRGYSPGSSPLYEFNGSLGLLVRSLLVVRICRLIILVVHNTSNACADKEEIRQAVTRSLTGPGELHPTLCAQFLNATTWKGLWNAVRYSALNRGADELVHLSRRRAKYKPPSITAVKLVVYSNLHPELEQLLSLMEPDVTLDRGTKPAASQVDIDMFANLGKHTIRLNQSTAIGRPDTVDSTNRGSIISQDNSSPTEAQTECSLAALWIEFGKRILFCYRRYAFCQRVKMRRTVKVISRSYLQHRLRHQTPVDETQGQICKLHDEYKSDIELIDRPPLHPDTFRNHERILLGLMPHVSVYLRGLECINQQQKEAGEKRFQTATYIELDGLWIKLGACALLTRQIEVLVRRIAPGSPALRKLNTLLEVTEQVDSLRSEIVRTFGAGVLSAALEEHYPLAWASNPIDSNSSAYVFEEATYPTTTFPITHRDNWTGAQDSPRRFVTRSGMEFMGEPKPSTPKEWILLARAKLWTAGKTVDVIQGLADIEPDLLEFLMSDDEIRGIVRESMFGPGFPATHASWLGSITCYLFQRFMTYFNRLPRNLNLVDRIIDEACRQITPYMVILSAFGQIQFATGNEEPVNKKSRDKLKTATAIHAHQNTSTVNPRLFTTLGLECPTTPQELGQIEAQVLQRLQGLLELLVDAFESPELGRYSKTLVFGNSFDQSSERAILSTTVEPTNKESNTSTATEQRGFPGSSNDMSLLGNQQVPSAALGLEPTAEWMLSLSFIEVDWKKTGLKLFDKGVYSQAAFCFGKAGLRVESDIASAYESRRQVRLLQVTQYNDQATCTAGFFKTAQSFLGCATLAKDDQQKSCYLRAAECFLQAKDWIAAAEAYYSAKDFNTAAKTFRRAGRLSKAVEVVKTHENDVQKHLVEEIIGVARLEYFRTGQLEKASGLFDDVDEQLEYMEDYGFPGERIHVLEYHKRYEEAAELAFASHNVVEGVRLLLRSDEPTSKRKAVEKALRGLWMIFPFGSTGDKQKNPAIGLLLELLSGSTGLSDEESRELQVFRALYANNADTLLALAQSSEMVVENSGSQTSFSILVLLCFSHSSHLLTPGSDSTISDFVQKGQLAWNYINQLLQFSQSLEVSSLNTQKLLGFELSRPSEEGEVNSQPAEYSVYSTSLIFEDAQKLLGDSAPSPAAVGLSFLAIAEVDIRRLALAAMHDRVRSEVRRIHIAANLSAYLYPCLEFAIFGLCAQHECGQQEVNSRDLPDEQRQDLFNQRTRALVIQIRTVHCYQVHNYQNEFERRDLRRTWACRLYEHLMPYFPPLGNIVCVDSRRAPELVDSTRAISAWCEDALYELDPGFATANKFLSDVLVYLDLSFRINQQSYILELHSRRLARPRDDLMVESVGPAPINYSIVHDFINFYARRHADVISRAVRAVHHTVFQSLAIEANVLVNMLEFIGREIIVQWRLYRQGFKPQLVFDQLLVPRSWAFEMIRRAPLTPQQGILLGEFFPVLYKTLELLHGYQATSSPLFGFSNPLSLLMRSVLLLRICRLVILASTVAHNTSAPPEVKEEIRQAIAQSLNGAGDIHSVLCAKFLKAGAWSDLLNAVRFSPLNRGADELVYLYRRQNNQNPPYLTAIKSIGYTSIKPELEKLLSLVEPRNMPNPTAKSIVPQTQNQASGGSGEDISKPAYTAVDDQLNAGEPPDWIASDDGPSLTPQVDLTASEIKAGCIILSCYRRYASRQQMKAKAVQTISAYYLRHRLRQKTPMTETGAQIRKFHEEYKADVESTHYSSSSDKVFRTLKRILLGFMPHVLFYLRGLENVNQQQKETNKKRLQKAQHAELDNIRIRMDTCATLTRKIRALSLRIKPGILMLHQIDALRDKVKEIDSLRSEIIRVFGEDVIPKSLDEHYALGISMILP